MDHNILFTEIGNDNLWIMIMKGSEARMDSGGCPLKLTSRKPQAAMEEVKLGNMVVTVRS